MRCVRTFTSSCARLLRSIRVFTKNLAGERKNLLKRKQKRKMLNKKSTSINIIKKKKTSLSRPHNMIGYSNSFAAVAAVAVAVAALSESAFADDHCIFNGVDYGVFTNNTHDYEAVSRLSYYCTLSISFYFLLLIGGFR